ncbi:MAG: hypothetical protein HRT88_00700 [Lentisphaeraceae bacterium]|nr:hypothetical protein [Lentisphaeraceae bacterium]
MNIIWEVYFWAESPLASDKCYDYFKARRNFLRLTNTVHYNNENTGVSFNFQFYENGGCGNLLPLVFCMNLQDSNSAYAREAAEEIKNFCNHFSANTFQLTDTTKSSRDFNLDNFLMYWRQEKSLNLNNNKYSAPSATLLTAWHWNYTRHWNSRFLRNEWIVPKISFLQKDGKIFSVVEIDAKKNNALPCTDYYFIRYAVDESSTVNTHSALIPYSHFHKVIKEIPYRQFGKTAFHKLSPQDLSCCVLHEFSEFTNFYYLPISSEEVMDEELCVHKAVVNSRIKQSVY